MKLADLDKRLSLTEQKLDTVCDDVAELKSDMKIHMEKSEEANDKLHTKIDKLFWLILSLAIGIAGFLSVEVFFK